MLIEELRGSHSARRADKSPALTSMRSGCQRTVLFIAPDRYFNFSVATFFKAPDHLRLLSRLQDKINSLPIISGNRRLRTVNKDAGQFFFINRVAELRYLGPVTKTFSDKADEKGCLQFRLVTSLKGQ